MDVRRFDSLVQDIVDQLLDDFRVSGDSVRDFVEWTARAWYIGMMTGMIIYSLL